MWERWGRRRRRDFNVGSSVNRSVKVGHAINIG
jgi:hypothetical protein